MDFVRNATPGYRRHLECQKHFRWVDRYSFGGLLRQSSSTLNPH